MLSSTLILLHNLKLHGKEKKEYTMSIINVIGIMTGTSCDGADASCVRYSTSGSKIVEKIIGTKSKRFPKDLKNKLLKAQKVGTSVQETLSLEVLYSLWMADFAKECINKFKLNPSNSILAIHGQTIWHAPNERLPYSLQILDPNIISAKTNFVTVSNFRQSDIALGGQGAPLVPLYNLLRSKSLGLTNSLPLSIHNIGGIANLSIVSNQSKQIVAFDTGPGNALIDFAMLSASKGKKTYDKNGNTAKKYLDKVNYNKIIELEKTKYFLQKPPKSTGKELFNTQYLNHFKVSGYVLVSAATVFTAYTMAKAYERHVIKKVPDLKTVYISGGGSKNKTLLTLFSNYLTALTGKKIKVSTLDSRFSDPQYLEATAFARLAYEAIHARRSSLGVVTGAKTDAIGVRITTSKHFLELMKNILKK